MSLREGEREREVERVTAVDWGWACGRDRRGGRERAGADAGGSGKPRKVSGKCGAAIVWF